MEFIQHRWELGRLAERLGVRADWHEPDEQGVTVEVTGNSFDNAFGAEGGHTSTEYVREKVVVIKKDGRPVAQLNLATLLAWATGYEGER